jgi:hypothetical protein
LPAIPAPAPATEPARRSVIDDFQQQIRRDGSITFVSWDGKRQGFDYDFGLKFLPQGQVELIEYGLGADAFSGHYQLSNSGGVTVDLKGSNEKPWPAMLLLRDPRSLLLVRVDARNVLPDGMHRGSTLEDGRPFWLFRPPRLPATKTAPR